ncbi:sulfurtransferase [Alcaligenes sp. WGS1538]|uniref:sulfurtransferase n=1 Tax=Alcaligenes sp. WGS1538 TaxID=3366811 RepID=UPI00372D7A11
MFDYLVTPEQLRANLGRADWLVFDVRHDLADHQAGRRAYEQGHIPGALFLDHETDLAAPRTGANGRHPLPDRQDLAALMRLQGLTSGMQVVAYDAQGSLFASHLWWMLRWLGHPHVAILDGGWQAWREAGGEVETGRRQPSVSEAQAVQSLNLPRQAAMPTVQADQVLANIAQPVFTVIDARAPERYRGEVEPMDPVAGHIPGALNRSHMNNLDAQGRFKPAGQLQQEFQALLGDTPASQVVHQCGSGITACHNLFAMELAGLNGSRIYPGSWSEWVSDPTRPVARG